jgi:hypothetical protein
MNANSHIRRKHHHLGLFLLSAVLIGMPTDVHAVCGLYDAVGEQVRQAKEVSRRTGLLFGSCSVCHLAGSGGPRNEYGNAINTLLRFSDRDDSARQREVGRRVMDIPANPLSATSPTFGELFQQGRFPARSLARQDPPLPREGLRGYHRPAGARAGSRG